MKTLTMVMRCGVKGAPTNQMNYTLIADDYSIVRLSGDELGKAIAAKKFIVTNMGVGPKGLVATNGSMDKYTLINPMTNAVEGKASPVILNRAETNGKLLGYTIFNADGILQEIAVAQAVKLHAITPFSNGKIRHTSDGDIIQSIEGNYPVRAIEVPKAQVGAIKIDVVFIGSAVGTGTGTVKYAGIFVNCDNAADLSKIHAKLASENKKLIEGVTKLGADSKVNESLAIKRTGTAGVYGVFPITVVFELIKKAGNKVTNKIGTVMVACTDYAKDGDESRVSLSPDLKVIEKVDGTARSEKALKGYLEEVLIALKQVKIEA